MAAPSFLRSFQALDAALRHGSFRAAAEALMITPAAVGQRIKALELYLGMDLLARGRSGLMPSPAAAAVAERLRAAFGELEAVAEALDLQRGHDIHVACVSDFAELWLKPRLPTFRAQHPNIRFCINGEGDAPLRLGAVDCTIDFGKPVEAAGRDVLFADYVLPVASPANVARIAAIAPEQRLEGFPLLHLDFYRDDPSVPDWAGWIQAQGLQRTAPQRGIRFQRITAVLEAVRADAGLTLCGLALLGADLERGDIALPYPVSTGGWTAHAFEARFRAEALARPQVRRFRTWLGEQAGDTRAWLATLTG